MPLYLLALWRCLDAATPAAVAFLGLATLAVTLSNFYGGLIGAVITPAAVAAYWLVMRPATGARSTPDHHGHQPRADRRLRVDVCVVRRARRRRGRNGLRVSARRALPVQREMVELSRSPSRASLVGPAVSECGMRRVFATAARAAGESRPGHRRARRRCRRPLALAIRNRQSACGIHVPVLVVAPAALACSLSPERPIGPTVVAPSALVYGLVPMFRAYARFGVVVQLMAALLAGIGVDFCVAPAPGARGLPASPSWPSWPPSTRSRPGRCGAMCCRPRHTAGSPGSPVTCGRSTARRSIGNQSIQWLTGYRVLLAAGSPSDCTEPNFSQKLAAGGYTHLLVRRDTAEGRWFATQPADGFRVAADLEDGQVLAVTAAPPPIYTATMTGFFRREHNAKGTWRWMAQDAPGRSRTPACSRSSRRWPLSCGHSNAARHGLLLDGRHVQNSSSRGRAMSIRSARSPCRPAITC